MMMVGFNRLIPFHIELEFWSNVSLYHLQGEWLHTQRSHKRDGTLTAERVASMQQLVDEGKVAWSLHWNTMPSEGVGLTPNDIRWEVGSRLQS